MKKVILAVVLMFLCTVSFAKRHKAKSNNTSAITSVELYHGACYGRCAVYKIAVDRDGIATYTGIRFTKDSGAYRKKIGKEAAQKILARYNDYRVDTCKDLYKLIAPDLPGVTLTVTYTDSTKTIRNVNAGPMSLRMLNGSLDSLAASRADNNWRPGKVPGQ